MFKVPEQWRLTDKAYGNNGCFSIPNPDGPGYLIVIASDGLGWEHVSVHIELCDGQKRTPTWSQIYHIKNLFWGDEDVVTQYQNTLHLWRLDEMIAGHIPTFPSTMVWPKDVQ